MRPDLSKLLNNLSIGAVAGLFLVAFAVSASGAGMLDNPMTSDQPAEVGAESNADYNGYVEIQHQRDVDGDGEYETVDTYKGHNQIVDQGLDYFQFQASGVEPPTATSGEDSSDLTATSGDTATVISLSNADTINGQSDTFDYTDATSLDGEIADGSGLDRVDAASVETGSVAYEAVGHYSVENTFTAGADYDQSAIEWTGLHWSDHSETDDLIAANHFPGVTMLSDDKLTISWTEVSFNR